MVEVTQEDYATAKAANLVWASAIGGPSVSVIAAAIARIAADRAGLVAEIERLREALGEICRDSNPDWTEKRVYPTDVLDDIHTIAVRAYYKVSL